MHPSAVPKLCWSTVILSVLLPVPHGLTDETDEVEGLFRLEGQTAVPGAQITIPFSVSGNLPVGGFALSVDFDEELLQCENITPAWERPDGEIWEFFTAEFNNLNEIPGNGGVDEGTLVAAAVFTFFTPDNAIPAGQETHALDITLEVLPGAEAGETFLEIVDGARQEKGVVVENVVALWDTDSSVIGGAPDVEITPVVIPALLRIVHATVFLRGDTNRDAGVDLSDAVTTLEFLFAGGNLPSCMDAADANDNGVVDMSDPITTLMFLFLGGSLPPPVDEPGPDPTEDTLGCSQ